MAKIINLIILQADRQLWAGGPVQLQVTDMRGGLHVLREETLEEGSIARLELDLPFDAGQVYGVSVDADEHRMAWQLIKRRTFLRNQGGTEIEVKEIFLRLMLVPEDPSSDDLDAGYDQLLAAGSPVAGGQNGWPHDDYVLLEDAAKMALLNIEAKLRETRINGLSLLSFVRGVSHVDVDRIYLYVKPELKQLVDNSPDFASAQGHDKIPKDTPVPLPGHPDSWKHVLFGAGNLQLSFSAATITLPGDQPLPVFSVDADIDLERGLMHVAEWLDNKIIHPSRKTNQPLVYALLFSQGIFPYYTLNPYHHIG